MTKIYFWGKGFQIIKIEDGKTLFHHTAFLNTMPNGRLELFIVSDYAIDAKVTSDVPVKWTELNKPTEDQFGTACVFKPSGVGQLILTIDGFACPPIRWSFTSKEKVVYDFEDESLMLQRYKTTFVWAEPRTPQFYHKRAVADMFTRVRNASSEDEREELKMKLVELLQSSKDDDKAYYITMLDIIASIEEDLPFERH